MAEQTFEQFVNCIEMSGLVDRARLGEIAIEIAPPNGDDRAACDALARRLVGDDLLTEWQIANLRKGKRSGFILGNYKILNMLGSGKHALVYLAEHTIAVGMLRSLKVLPSWRAANTAYVERFLNEVSVTARMNHANVRQAFEVNQHGKYHYLVLGYINGSDLQTAVNERGPFDCRTAINVIRQAAEAVAHLHEQGVVHRDIKPRHLMIDDRGDVYLLDLSLARLIDGPPAESAGIAADDAWSAADYLAPEQARDSRLVDPRTDVYSLGCLLHFALTGHEPFAAAGRNATERLLMHQTAERPSLLDAHPGVPAELAELCSRMMARSPDDRPQTADEVVAKLSAIQPE